MAEWTIYNNRIPFSLLSTDEQAAMKAHKGEWELFNCLIWIGTFSPGWNGDTVYRAVKSVMTDAERVRILREVLELVLVDTNMERQPIIEALEATK